MSCTIRNAVIEDVNQLLPLMETLGYPSTREVLQSLLTQYLASSEKLVWVAELEGVLVGVLALELLTPFHTIQKQAFIQTLVVADGHHQQGIGKQLLDHACQTAQDLHCTFIALTSGIKRTQARSFYEKNGFGVPSAHLYFKKELNTTTKVDTTVSTSA